MNRFSPNTQRNLYLGGAVLIGSIVITALKGCTGAEPVPVPSEPVVESLGFQAVHAVMNEPLQ